MLKFNKLTREELNEYMKMGLDEKIKLSSEIIQDFLSNVDNDKVYISSSFGKDSVVTIDLVRKENPDIPILFMNTGVEHKSCIELSKEYDNVIELTPKKGMKQIVEEYGYILPLGKDKSNAIEQVRRNIHDGKFDTYRCKQFRGDLTGKMFDYTGLVPHLLAPFKISDRCCYYLKRSPISSFQKKEGYDYYFTGITAEESMHRRNALVKNGFNTDTQSSPIGHWRANDVLEYIVKNGLKLASCYGDVVEENGKYSTTLFQRTGCVCCPVSAHREKPNKFQLFYENERDTWDFVINELGYGKVLDWFDIPYHEIPKELKEE